MRDTAIIIDSLIETQGGNVGVLREYAEKSNMAFFIADSPLGAFDSIFIKRKLNVRNLIFVTTYESDNVDFKADIKICANKNPSILLGLLDDFYYKYIKPYHTLDYNECNNNNNSKIIAGHYNECNNNNNDKIRAGENSFMWYSQQDMTNERHWLPETVQEHQTTTNEPDEMFIRL